MNELALFAGAGGGILGGSLLGWRTVCAVESNEYARSVLIARQNDGCLEPFPIWDDVQTFDGRPWNGLVDVVSGGFPCQDISQAGKGAGIQGEKSGLWQEMARIICEVEPRFVFVENVPALTSRGLDVVLGDLAEMGFDAKWGVLGAHHAGAPHKRDRLWIVANSQRGRVQSIGGSQLIPRTTTEMGGKILKQHTPRRGSEDRSIPCEACGELWCQRCLCHWAICGCPGIHDGEVIDCPAEPATTGQWWDTESAVGRVAHGVANGIHRLKALGNGQVPAVAALAWRVLNDEG